MIFKGLRLFAPRLSQTYTQAMYEAWKANPSDVHEDWHAVFSNQDKMASTVAGNPDHIEREKSLALSAYLLIRYYKMRGH
jgi:2-oxoglutarate dehydrogenase complex dehydrogenase (E1) component-like enzyme